MLELSEELLYLRPIQLLRHIPPLPGGKRQFVDLRHERRELALEGEGRSYQLQLLISTHIIMLLCRSSYLVSDSFHVAYL